MIAYFGFGFVIFSSLIKFGTVGFHRAGFTLVLPPVLGLVGYVLTWSGRKKCAGVVLLDLGRYFEESTVGILVAGLSIVNAVNLVISAFSHFSKSSEIAFYWLIGAMIFGFLGISWILLSLNHLEIRERGICYPFTVIKWEVIEAYRWIGYQENTLCLRHRAKFPFFPLLKLKIHLANKSRVEQLLSQYLPEQ